MTNLRRIVLGTLIVSAAFSLVGCPDVSLLDGLGGATGPTPGNFGAISVDAFDRTTISISWTAATDDKTAAAEIEYQVYYSTSNNIGTAENAGTNGTTVFTDWTAAAV
ncbi:MAG: hypothetical protein V3S41_00325, partial [Spirochaetia bacterium]